MIYLKLKWKWFDEKWWMAEESTKQTKSESTLQSIVASPATETTPTFNGMFYMDVPETDILDSSMSEEDRDRTVVEERSRFGNIS